MLIMGFVEMIQYQKKVVHQVTNTFQLFNSVGTIFHMTTPDQEPIDGAKIAFWVLRTDNVDFALVWHSGMEKIPF